MDFVKALGFLLLLFVVDRCQADDKIFTGLREVAPNTYPWVGWILIGKKRVKCGAVLIAPDKALTAASCLTSMLSSVSFGDHVRSDTDGQEQVFSIESTIIHPEFDPTTYENDVAILNLNGTASINNVVQTIPLLPDDNIADRVLSKHCRVAGWGYVVNGSTDLVRDQSDVLLEVTVDKIDEAVCTAAGAPTTTAICYEPFRDPTSLTCEGDSGGAYMCKRKGVWTLAGIMSDWMIDQGCTAGARMATTIPSVYDWVNSIM